MTNHYINDLLNIGDEIADSLSFVNKYENLEEGYNLQVIDKLNRVILHNKLYGYRRKSMPITGLHIMEYLRIPPTIYVRTILDRLERSYWNGEWNTFEEGMSKL